MTTFGIPAGCGRLIEYDNTQRDLPELWREGLLKTSPMHIGGGSNLLFTTGKFCGTVLHSLDRSFTLSEPDTEGYVTLKASAGCVLDTLCAVTAERGLWGMENLSGIPGEIGGAAVQNVGAYGTEFSDIAVSIDVFDTVTGNFSTLSTQECAYGYRESIFKHLKGKYIIAGASIRLNTISSPRLSYTALKDAVSGIAPDRLSPMSVRKKVLELRDSKLPSPAITGSAGSFFKNPVINAAEFDALCRRTGMRVPAHLTENGDAKLSAAWLIDHAGCKPLSYGGAALWQSQPLVIVNATGRATGNDVVTLEEMVCRKVYAEFGIKLVPEVIHI